MTTSRDPLRWEIGVTADQVEQLRHFAEHGSYPEELLDRLRQALLFYDLVRKAWLGTREEYTELETTVRANQQAADREYKRRVVAEGRVRELEDLEARLATAEAENERLRAECERLQHVFARKRELQAIARADAAEARLATAEGLLDTFKAGYNALPAMPSREQWKALCVSTMTSIEGWPTDDASPAQPAATLERCPDHDMPKVNEAFYRCGCRFYPMSQPAAPRLCGACEDGRPDDCSGWCGVSLAAQPAEPAHTEASDPADRVLAWAGPAARADLGLPGSHVGKPLKPAAPTHPMAGTELNQYDEPAAPAQPGQQDMTENEYYAYQPAAPDRTEADPMTAGERDSWKGRVAFWKHTAESIAQELEVKTRRTDGEGKGVGIAELDNLAGAIACCRAWDPEARLIGNVRASTLLRLLCRTEAEQAVLDAAMRWHVLDTSVNAEALHHYCAALAPLGLKP